MDSWKQLVIVHDFFITVIIQITYLSYTITGTNKIPKSNKFDVDKMESLALKCCLIIS